MKKWKTLVLALVASVASATLLTACDMAAGFINDLLIHHHEYDEVLRYDETKHYHVCTSEICDGVSEGIEHDFVVLYTEEYSKEYSTCTMCGYATEETAHTHVGGMATCTEKAECTGCVQKYGDEPTCAYGEPIYVWSEDNATCTATRVCLTDGMHIKNVAATVTSQVTKTQSNTQVEVTTFTATFAEIGLNTQVKNVQTKDVSGVAKVNGIGYETLNAAIAAITSKGEITILTGGEYALPSFGAVEITFKGTKDVVIDMTSAVKVPSAIVVFDGVTMKFDNDYYEGLHHALKEVYRNCHVIGKMFLYAPEAEFINCTFANKTDYCVWTYGSQDVTFTDCTFYTGGKAVLVYNDLAADGFVADISFKNCAFYDDGTLAAAGKGAVETGSNGGNTETSNRYSLTFTDCSVEGFVENPDGIATNSTLYGNKNSMDKEHLNVVVDGTDVY